MYTNFAKEDEKVIPRATVFKLMSHLTSSNKGILTAFDYITERFVNEPCEMLQEVIDFSICTTKNSELTRLLYASRHFLNHVYKSHATKKEDMCKHGLNYCLGRKPVRDRENNKSPSCKFSLCVFSQIKELVTHPSNTCVDAHQR